MAYFPMYINICICLQWERNLYRNGTENISLLGPLVRTFWTFFIAGAVLQLVYIFLVLANPQLLNLLIEFVEEKQEMWKGYLYVGVLGAVSFLIGLFIFLLNNCFLFYSKFFPLFCSKFFSYPFPGYLFRVNIV